ncbi:MAG: glycosyltransferase [Vicinamibacterales bacterium]
MPSERWGEIEATYPTAWTVPRLARRFRSRDIYQSVRKHIIELHKLAPFDAIIGAFAFPDIVVAASLARDLGCPLIALVLGSDINELARHPRLRPQIREALVQSHLVVALTRPLRDRVVELGVSPDNVTVQHNGVDGAHFRLRDRDEARRHLNIQPATPLICYVGNLVQEKGPDVVLKAVGMLKTPARLVFVGDGNLKNQLQADSTRLGIADRVTFVGRQPLEQIPLWMAAADVLCLPSRREGCPNVVLEALACGTPVVASCVGGVPELLSERNGLMVQPDDPVGLASALDVALGRTWDSKDLRDSVGALSWDAFADVFKNAIQASHGFR